jgi:ribosome-binding protein aMBF1 (putative translation factor)
MAATLPTSSASRHRVLSDVEPRMAKAALADVRKPDTRMNWAEIGACLDYARRDAGWNLEQLAAALDKDARQVRRWIAGEEQTQVAVVFAVRELQQPFVIALAKLAACEVTTHISISRRTA